MERLSRVQIDYMTTCRDCDELPEESILVAVGVESQAICLRYKCPEKAWDKGGVPWRTWNWTSTKSCSMMPGTRWVQWQRSSSGIWDQRG